MKTTKKKKLRLAWVKTLKDKKEDMIEAVRYVAIGLILQGMLSPKHEDKHDKTKE